MRFAFVVAASLACSASFAHDTWLLPDPQPGETAVLLNTGPQYPRPGTAHSARDVAELGPRPVAGGIEETDRGLRIPVRSRVVWVTLVEAVVDLTDEQVAAYFDEINPPDYVRRAWANAGAGRRWREAYTKYAKAVLPGAGDSWRTRVGQRLEIVPETDPRALKAGARLTVRVWMDGRPLPGLAVFCVDPRGMVGGKGRTDADGRISCTLAGPGSWLVRGTELRRAQSGGASWQSLWATLTVPVRP